MPAVINTRKAVKHISIPVGLLRAWQKNPSTTKRNKTTIRQSEREPGAKGVIKLPECLNIKFEDLKKVRKFGKGAFASVYEAKWLGCPIAMKRIKELMSNTSVSELQLE